MNTRPSLKELGLGTGKKARLHRILHEHGVRNGTTIFLPYDHGLEHGPRDFSGHPESADPRHVIRLAVEGGFNGIAIQIGLARKFYWEYAGEVPLVLKLNGKTDIPSPADPVSPVNATVEEAVRLGADAVGYTLYVGTPGQERDFAQYLRVRTDAERFGMPLIVWSYPRGAAIDAVVRSANRSLLLVSGGERAGDEAMLEKARQSMEAGATGFIFGRNVFQRDHGESLRLVAQLKEILAKYPS